MFLVEEPVIAVAIKGHAKAYPLSILTVHEISNDTLNGEAILLTYCLFCNSGIVYHRAVQINGKSLVLEFKVYSMLRNSDMIMYDRKIKLWWQQHTGEALVGELTDVSINIIPSMIISVEAFFEV